MSLDPEAVGEARSWFQRAIQDLDAADFEMTANPPFTADVAFHAQQAAEKAMKGFLVWHGTLFRKTHNLVEIGRACSEVDPQLEDLLREAAPLTEFAWKFRYPGEPLNPSVEEATAALETARTVVAGVLERLPDELSP